MTCGFNPRSIYSKYESNLSFHHDAACLCTVQDGPSGVQNLLNRMMQNIQYLSQNSAHIYPFVQGNFVKGITLGGVKG